MLEDLIFTIQQFYKCFTSISKIIMASQNTIKVPLVLPEPPTRIPK